MASEIALPGMIAAAPAPAPDVTIRRAPVPPSLDDAASTGDRVVSVTCKLCHVARKIWFRLGSSSAN